MSEHHIVDAIIRMPESTTVEVSQWAYGLELNFIGLTLPDGFEAREGRSHHNSI